MFVSGNFELISTTSGNEAIKQKIGQVGMLYASECSHMRFELTDGNVITSSRVIAVCVLGGGKHVTVRTQSGTEYQFSAA